MSEATLYPRVCRRYEARRSSWWRSLVWRWFKVRAPWVDCPNDCTLCLGKSWHWSDDKPPTLCLDTMPTQAKDRRGLPCGRSNGTCPGCGRSASVIPTPEDIERTKTLGWPSPVVPAREP